MSAPQSSPAVAKPPRIRLWPLTLRLLLALVAPVAVALLLDWALGTLPWLTMATSLICIPLATVIVGKATLRDFARVVEQVAPSVPTEPAAPAETAAPDRAKGEGPDASASDPARNNHIYPTDEQQ